ncbi:DsbA family protein [Ruegeria sp.]|uniref:DsbA family protein n=1 Tax=Ruegeria sp. TaxID=1879320 RepID=UPI003B00C9B9
MPFTSLVKPRLAEIITSRGLQNARRGLHELGRRARGARHEVHYFHDASDPYCALTAQVLPAFEARYDIALRPHLISGPPAEAVPDPKAHRENAIKDATRLAQKLGLDAPKADGVTPEVNARLAAQLGEPDFAQHLKTISAAQWAGRDLPAGKQSDPAAATSAGDLKLRAMGHYLGGTFYYGGEWYWGVDRLHYLEDRFQSAGLGTGPLLVPPPELAFDSQDATPKTLEFFFSFRSPYSYLAFDRVQHLADQCNAELILRPVLPMLMRGLPVPKAKSRYILQDCMREARRLGIPFGRICDPLGSGIERGYALFDYAESEGRMGAFCSTFMRSVWSVGVDAASDKGLSQIVKAAGLNWPTARDQLKSQTWRRRVEQNQNRLQDVGLWGVPSFHVDGQSIWGQDRLWAVADLLGTESKQALPGFG